MSRPGSETTLGGAIVPLVEVATTRDLANRIIHAEALEALRELPSGLAATIVTSPPYFGQRDYGTAGQLGAEASVGEYVERLVGILMEARRVLHDRGTLWLNLGDKFLNGQLAGAPWRVALALQEKGWFLRSDIIWHKPNAMPHPVKTRPTPDHEYLFLFSKSASYHYDADAIREPHVTFSPESKMRGGKSHFFKRAGTPEVGKNTGNTNLHDGRWDQAFHEKGRNKRTVWSVPLSKFREAHFAVYPEKLITPCILAGCPEDGLVLDPFFGAGTTGVVARANARNFLGIELNADYCAIALRRLERHP